MRKLAVIAALAVAGTLSAQSPFYVSYHWQYGESAQSNCVAENYCHITFPAQEGQPYAQVTPYFGSGGRRLAFQDGNGNHGSAPVSFACQSDSCQFTISNMTIYDAHGSVVGTMSETYSYTVKFIGGRDCPQQGCIEPIVADLN